MPTKSMVRFLSTRPASTHRYATENCAYIACICLTPAEYSLSLPLDEELKLPVMKKNFQVVFRLLDALDVPLNDKVMRVLLHLRMFSLQ